MTGKLTSLANTAAAGLSSPLASETLGKGLGKVGGKVGDAAVEVGKRLTAPHGDFVNKTGKAKEANTRVVTDEGAKTHNVQFDRFANQYMGNVKIESFKVSKDKGLEKAKMVITVETQVPTKNGKVKTVMREFEITIRGKEMIEGVLGKDRSPTGQTTFANEFAKICLVGSDVMHQRAAFSTSWTVDIAKPDAPPTFKQKGLLFTSDKDELAGKKILTEHVEESTTGNSFFLGDKKGELLSFADYHSLIMQRILQKQSGKDDAKGKAPDSVELEEDTFEQGDSKKQKQDALGGTTITNNGPLKLKESKNEGVNAKKAAAALIIRKEDKKESPAVSEADPKTENIVVNSSEDAEKSLNLIQQAKTIVEVAGKCYSTLEVSDSKNIDKVHKPHKVKVEENMVKLQKLEQQLSGSQAPNQEKIKQILKETEDALKNIKEATNQLINASNPFSSIKHALYSLSSSSTNIDTKLSPIPTVIPPKSEKTEVIGLIAADTKDDPKKQIEEVRVWDARVKKLASQIKQNSSLLYSQSQITTAEKIAEEAEKSALNAESFFFKISKEDPTNITLNGFKASLSKYHENLFHNLAEIEKIANSKAAHAASSSVAPPSTVSTGGTTVVDKDSKEIQTIRQEIQNISDKLKNTSENPKAQVLLLESKTAQLPRLKEINNAIENLQVPAKAQLMSDIKNVKEHINTYMVSSLLKKSKYASELDKRFKDLKDQPDMDILQAEKIKKDLVEIRHEYINLNFFFENLRKFNDEVRTLLETAEDAPKKVLEIGAAYLQKPDTIDGKDALNAEGLKKFTEMQTEVTKVKEAQKLIEELQNKRNEYATAKDVENARKSADEQIALARKASLTIQTIRSALEKILNDSYGEKQ